MDSIAETIASRTQFGLADLFLAVYDHAYCAGAGLIIAPAAETPLSDMLLLLSERHRVEVLAPRGWVDPPRMADDLPGWLRAQERQVGSSD